MFKKYLVLFLFLILPLFLNNKANAFVLPNNDCQQADYTASDYVISQLDLKGNIIVCAKDSDINQLLYLYKKELPPATSTLIYTLSATGINQKVGYPTTFLVSELNTSKQFTFILSDNQGQAVGNYFITLVPAPIIMHNNYNPEIQNGGNVATGTPITFTCSSSTELYFDSVLKDSDYNGSKNYSLSYTFPNTDPVPTQHTVICVNIGGTTNQNVFVFNTIGSSVKSGTINAPDCTIAIGSSSCSTTITWSTTNPGSNISAVTSETDATGASSPNNTISTGNSGTKTVTIPYTVLGSHQGRNFYLYNGGTQLAQDTATANCAPGSTWDGSKCKQDAACPPPVGGSLVNGVCTCPSGQNDINGTCGTCPSGTTYDSGSKTCKQNSSCPTGQNNIMGTCGVCPANSVYSSSLGKCVCGNGAYVGIGGNCGNTVPPTKPVCSFTDGTYNFVQCTNIPTCPSTGDPAQVFVDTSNGSFKLNPPDYTFNWSTSQITYRFICPNGDPVIPTQQATKRPYTHFINFNVSAGYIKKGSGINLSWIVQDPTTTCQIIATDIKTGATLLDTSSTTMSNFSTKLNKSLTTSTSTSLINRISSSNYKTQMNKLYTVNQSTRFTAKCINYETTLINPDGSTSASLYMPGPNQLVRDVYLTGESER